ncbi:MAG: hypothetical protein ACXVA9_02730 [Bdellovibrionales bacterium]
MKLYRGIKADEYAPFSPELSKQLRATWKPILESREDGDFSYPDEINGEILEAAKLTRLQRQHFTDNQAIAESYARENDGLLIELEIPIADVLQYFTIEFQKFAQRKKNFEIVYAIDAENLFSMSKKWKLKASPT